MAELFIRANKHWMDDYTTEKINSLNESEKESFNARSQIGDIVLVYADGICKESPSINSIYYLIKVKDLSEENARKYIESEYTDKEKVITDRILKDDWDNEVKQSEIKNQRNIKSVKMKYILSENSKLYYEMENTVIEKYISKYRKYKLVLTEDDLNKMVNRTLNLTLEEFNSKLVVK